MITVDYGQDDCVCIPFVQEAAPALPARAQSGVRDEPSSTRAPIISAAWVDSGGRAGYALPAPQASEDYLTLIAAPSAMATRRLSWH